jgi:hypothetical protein
MKSKEINVGGHYLAKVSGQLQTVRVDAIREVFGGYTPRTRKLRTVFDCTNVRTRRRITVRSPQRFRATAPAEQITKA